MVVVIIVILSTVVVSQGNGGSIEWRKAERKLRYWMIPNKNILYNLIRLMSMLLMITAISEGGREGSQTEE